ncbi:uncharacterized protein K452DRAFT_14184 [Aplosporella prunicola CBS 121167]|uniref:Uncharacterized protein n=1 Tax=Aplosporella prunicola CBS 121167 TaxID=1176127 RepID=A0A6A6BJL7_9PEZI|nr:uncharacterized protein K452DRAFT_14184 [Aplosporella prunicola CBS 121167]KAF2143007.1 hypothetical protein K452DRAFT_14184 [Aplosporella prunicola CBS 121167]
MSLKRANSASSFLTGTTLENEPDEQFTKQDSRLEVHEVSNEGSSSSSHQPASQKTPQSQQQKDRKPIPKMIAHLKYKYRRAQRRRKSTPVPARKRIERMDLEYRWATGSSKDPSAWRMRGDLR